NIQRIQHAICPSIADSREVRVPLFAVRRLGALSGTARLESSSPDCSFILYGSFLDIAGPDRLGPRAAAAPDPDANGKGAGSRRSPRAEAPRSFYRSHDHAARRTSSRGQLRAGSVGLR